MTTSEVTTPLQLLDKGRITWKESVEEIGRRWVTTWHLTAARNLVSIQQQGLRLYPLRKDYFPEEGIWLWAEPLEGMNLHWTVIQRMIDNETDEIALLKVRIRLSWTWLTERAAFIGLGDEIGVITHHGQMHGQHNHFVYHESFPARISLQPIPWRYIKVDRIFRLQGMKVVP